MPILELRREAPLSPRERALLPGGCAVITDEPGVLARANSTLPLPRLIQLAVAMGRAVPDAALHVEEERGAEQLYAVEREAPPPPVAAEPAVAALAQRKVYDDHQLSDADPANPWSSLDLSDLDRAAARFVGHALDGPGRDRVRALLRATDPAELALGCRIAGVTGWRSAVQQVKPCLRHADSRVRVEAAVAVGLLGGPALSLQLRGMVADPAPEVRAAVAEALARLG